MKSGIWRFSIALATVCLCAQPLLSNAAEGDWLVRGGLALAQPKDDSFEYNNRDLSVNEATSVTFEGVYMIRDNWGMELSSAWPFEHDVRLDGAGDVAQIEQIPTTLSLQYHFNPEGDIRPYVGLGLNFTIFSRVEEQGAFKDGFELGLDDTVGVGAQIGMDFTLVDDWFTNLSLRYIDMQPESELNGDSLQVAEISPVIFQAQVGYRFRKSGPAPVPVAAAPAPRAAPADADGDGVTDDKDRCPATPRGDRVGSQGCSCDVTRQVQFVFDSAELTPEGEATLDEVVEQLKRLQFVSGTVVGHTDGIGTDEYNLDLSKRRAATVADYLQSKGVAQGRMSSDGKGKSQPIADNATEEGRAMNRRVVISRTDCDAPG